MVEKKTSSNWIDHYQDHFADSLADLERILESGETEFARVIARLQRAAIERQQFYVAVYNPESGEMQTYAKAKPDQVFADTLPTDVRCSWPTATRHGHMEVPSYIWPEDFLPRFIADHVRMHDIDAVVDLGGGWGRALFQAWLAGAPSSASYYCLDTSRSAEEIFERLCALDPRADTHFVHGNARDNDLSFVGGAERLLLVTSGYIIMDPKISRPDINKWAAAAPMVHCLHLEPIGFQVQQDGQGQGTHDLYLSKWVPEHGMNTTFMAHLIALHEKGTVRLSNIQKHYLFDSDPGMPKSLIFWRTD